MEKNGKTAVWFIKLCALSAVVASVVIDASLIVIWYALSLDKYYLWFVVVMLPPALVVAIVIGAMVVSSFVWEED